MNLDAELLGLDELPDDARAAVDEAERAVAAVRAAAENRAGAARAEEAVAAVEQAATRELAPLVRGLVERLRALQEAYARAGKLDEALAIRARVIRLRIDLLGVRPDPGNLVEFGPDHVGRSLLFEITGRTDGTVWGTDVYTTDSRLSAAAVHAGAVRVGERALVRVTFLDGTVYPYGGSTRNEVQSFDYGTYPIAFRVEKL
jgi:hypothetical protein